MLFRSVCVCVCVCNTSIGPEQVGQPGQVIVGVTPERCILTRNSSYGHSLTIGTQQVMLRAEEPRVGKERMSTGWTARATTTDPNMKNQLAISDADDVGQA